jgi:hypothetical protein
LHNSYKKKSINGYSNKQKTTSWAFCQKFFSSIRLLFYGTCWKWILCLCIFQDIPTGADSCATSLISDTSGRSLLVAGFGDGTVRLFDRRLSPTEWWAPSFFMVRCHGFLIVQVSLVLLDLIGS